MNFASATGFRHVHFLGGPPASILGKTIQFSDFAAGVDTAKSRIRTKFLDTTATSKPTANISHQTDGRNRNLSRRPCANYGRNRNVSKSEWHVSSCDAPMSQALLKRQAASSNHVLFEQTPATLQGLEICGSEPMW